MTPYKRMLQQYAERAERIKKLRAAGWTLAKIARRHGISKQRVWQVLK